MLAPAIHTVQVHHPAIPNGHPVSSAGVLKVSDRPESAQHWTRWVARCTPALVVHLYHP